MPEFLCDLEMQVEDIMIKVPVLCEVTSFPVDYSYWQSDFKDHDFEFEGENLTQWSYSFVPSTHANKNLRGGKLTVQYVYNVGKGEHLVLATLNSPHDKEKKDKILEQVLNIYDTFFKQK